MTDNNNKEKELLDIEKELDKELSEEKVIIKQLDDENKLYEKIIDDLKKRLMILIYDFMIMVIELYELDLITIK